MKVKYNINIVVIMHIKIVNVYIKLNIKLNYLYVSGVLYEYYKTYLITKLFFIYFKNCYIIY